MFNEPENESENLSLKIYRSSNTSRQTGGNHRRVVVAELIDTALFGHRFLKQNFCVLKTIAQPNSKTATAVSISTNRSLHHRSRPEPVQTIPGLNFPSRGSVESGFHPPTPPMKNHQTDLTQLPQPAGWGKRQPTVPPFG